MRDIVDIIVQLKSQAASGTKSDRRLAGIVLSDLAFASQCAIADLAAKAEVSEPTVTRFCRRLGCDGMKELKFRLAQAMAVGGQYLSDRTTPQSAGDSRVANLVISGAKGMLDHTLSGLPFATLDDVARRLAGAGQILALGSGGTSSMLAVELQNRLFRLGLNAVSYTDGQMQRMAAAMASPSCVVIAFSISGYVKSIVDSTSVARHYGAFTFAITAPHSALAATAEVVMPFNTIEDGNIYKPSSSRFALLAIVDILATLTAEAIGPPVLEGLRRIKHNINRLKVENPDLPLGD